MRDDALLLSLYSSINSKTGFNDFLEKLCAKINACAAEICIVQKQPLQVKMMWYVGLTDDFIDWYTQNDMIKHDLVTGHVAYQSPGSFQTAASLFTQTNTKGNYEKWLKDHSMIDTVWLVISSNQQDTTFLALQRTTDQGYYSEEDINSLNVLIPYIQQTVSIYDQLSGQRLSDSTLASIVNAFPIPTVILNDSAKIIYINEKADKLLAHLPLISMSNERLRFQHTVDDDAFLRALTKITRSSMGLKEYDTDALLLERGNQPPLILTLNPIIDNISSFKGLMVNLFDVESRAAPSINKIMKYYSLTYAEANLCENLLKGISLKEIAILSNKSELTLRTYLKQVYQKTGFKRQGELISSMLHALLVN